MRKLLLQLIVLLAFSMSGQTQNLPKFAYKDANGCTFEFQLESRNGHEVALLSAKNNKKPRLEIPETVSNKGVTYTVVRVMSESLKKCDNKIRVLIFPNSVQTIGSYLFGSVMKLMGGFGGALKGGTGGPLSNIRLESLKIPSNVKDIAPAAFVTGLTTCATSGMIGLSAKIEELPNYVLPWESSTYGIMKNDITEYWQRTDPEKISPQAAAQGKQKFLQKTANRSVQERNKELGYFYGTEEYSQLVLPSLMAQITERGVTREEYIAALQGHTVSNLLLPEEPIASTPKATIPIEAIEYNQISISEIVQQIPESNSNDFKNLIEKLKTDESKQKYESAINTVTLMMMNTSNPLLYYVRAICHYKAKNYRKSMNDCSKAIKDGRLNEEYTMNASALLQVSSDKFIARLDKISNAIETIGTGITESVSNAMAQRNSNYYTNTTISSVTPKQPNSVSSNRERNVSKKIKCPKCDGSGKCVYCKGTGKRTHHYKKNGKWYDTIDCPYCDGNGYCSECDGSKWIDTEDIPSTPASVPSPSTSSSNGGATSKTYRTCSWCNGSGRTVSEYEGASFGLTKSKERRLGKCSECGAQLYKGVSHKHYNCNHCNGTGKLEN